MVRSCSVPLCTSRRTCQGKIDNISFHEIPSNNTRDIWIKNINLASQYVDDRVLVCSLHFEDSCFIPDLKIRKLTSSAVPTIFPNPSCVQKEIKTRCIKRRPFERQENNAIICAVFGCRNIPDKSKTTKFYSFPSTESEARRKQLWTNFCKRKTKDGTQWQPTKNSKLCSAHFVGNEKSEDPNSPSYNPTCHPSRAHSDQCDELKFRYQSNPQRRKIPGGYLETEDENINDVPHDDLMESGSISGGDIENKSKCFVCFECNETEFDSKHFNLPLKMPNRVIDRLQNKLCADIVQSLKNTSFGNSFCKMCLQMSDEIFKLCCKVEHLNAQIEKATDEYASRITNCREYPGEEDIKPLIRVSQNCFEDDYSKYCNDLPEMTANPDSCDYSNANDPLAISKNRWMPLLLPETLEMSRKSHAPSRKLRLMTKKTRENNEDFLKFGLKEVEVSIERIQEHKLKCKNCFKFFASNRALENHQKTHIHYKNNKDTAIKTYQAKKPKSGRRELEPCKICHIRVFPSYLKVHMKYYHPNEPVESETNTDVEVGTENINERLIVENLPTPVEPTGIKNGFTAIKSNLKCLTCNNQLIHDVPEVNRQQLQSVIKKFPGQHLLYCSHCNKALVVAAKNKEKVPLFQSQGVLKKHKLKNPLNEKRQIRTKRLCENCGKQFINYKKHKQLCEKQSGRKYECKECQNKQGDPLLFESKRRLKMHVKLYHVLVPKCNLCAREFSQLSSLRKHRLLSHRITIK